jgi:hypothetical protein
MFTCLAVQVHRIKVVLFNGCVMQQASVCKEDVKTMSAHLDIGLCGRHLITMLTAAASLGSSPAWMLNCSGGVLAIVGIALMMFSKVHIDQCTSDRSSACMTYAARGDLREGKGGVRLWRQPGFVSDTFGGAEFCDLLSINCNYRSKIKIWFDMMMSFGKYQ